MSRAIFELGGALASALPELAVGPWTTAPPGQVAFDADPGPLESLWRVELARDDAAGRSALAEGERSVARTLAALDAAPRRFDLALAALADPGRREAHEARAGAGSGLPWIEADLVAALASLDGELAPASSETADPPRSRPASSATAEQVRAGLASWGVAAPRRSRAFAVPRASDAGLSWDGAGAASRVPGSAVDPPGAIERALQRMADLARGRARIETHLEGALVAMSITTLSGHTELRIAPGLSIAGARLHARSVAVATRTRFVWARALALVVSSGGRIAALGVPAASISALPLAWRFVSDVLREVRARTAADRRAA